MTADIWFLLAIGFSFAGYASYLIGLRRELVEPNRASWLIWSAATSLEALTYAAVNPGAPQGWVFALSSIACILVTIGIWRRSSWAPPSPTETF
ncbi:MAG: SET domain-containing protein-lysine N-methyltransferase, partial [Proteobacteria bacterium]|nr:SET domain-containing protein-lysine N-methyltransferase [Pseudomonadota bacterium]